MRVKHTHIQIARERKSEQKRVNEGEREIVREKERPIVVKTSNTVSEDLSQNANLISSPNNA